MWRFIVGVLALLMLLPAAHAQDDTKKVQEGAEKKVPQDAQEDVEKKEEPSTPAEKYQALLKEYGEAYSKFLADYRAAEGEEKMKMAREGYPKMLAEFAAKFYELHQSNPDDPVAAKAEAWIFRYASSSDEANQLGEGILAKIAEELDAPDAMARLVSISRARIAAAQEAKKMLVEHFVDNDEFTRVCFSLDEEGLRSVMEKTKNRAVKGHAMVALGTALLGRPIKPNKEGEALLTKVVEEYGDVDSFRGKLAAMAEGPLFELNHLQIGMVAPNIEGTDVDDESFQLEDYRGKVVVLDFWGDW